jgi:hypothetical protein
MNALCLKQHPIREHVKNLGKWSFGQTKSRGIIQLGGLTVMHLVTWNRTLPVNFQTLKICSFEVTVWHHSINEMSIKHKPMFWQYKCSTEICHLHHLLFSILPYMWYQPSALTFSNLTHRVATQDLFSD